MLIDRSSRLFPFRYSKSSLDANASRYHPVMSSEFDVIVIGVGGMGAAACYHLARRGVRVLGIEAHDIPHALGASHGHTRMTRTAYYEHPGYVPMIRRANELWRELEKETGLSLLQQVGGLYMGKYDGELIAGSLLAASRHSIDHQILDHSQLRKRFDVFNLDHDVVGFLEPAAGYLMAENCTCAHAHAAMMRGAQIHTHEQVIDWSDASSGIVVRTDRAVYRANQIVVCAGPWAGRVLDDLKIHLTITRQQLAWFWPLEPQRFIDLPVWAIDTPGAGIHYGFPMRADLPGFKLAHHHPFETTDPDNIDRTTTAPTADALRAYLKQHIPAAAGELLSVKTCMYANSPDHHFIIGKQPGNMRVNIAAGFSGHGYKFASVMGEMLAQLAIDGVTLLDTAWLKPDRLTQPL